MTWLTPVVATLCFVLGGLLVACPRRAIEVQIAFYRRINWKMEPISWAKEIFATRLMGLVVMVAAVVALSVRLKG